MQMVHDSLLTYLFHRKSQKKICCSGEFDLSRWFNMGHWQWNCQHGLGQDNPVPGSLRLSNPRWRSHLECDRLKDPGDGRGWVEEYYTKVYGGIHYDILSGRSISLLLKLIDGRGAFEISLVYKSKTTAALIKRRKHEGKFGSTSLYQPDRTDVPISLCNHAGRRMWPITVTYLLNATSMPMNFDFIFISHF